MRVLVQTAPTKWGEDVYSVFYGKEAVEYKENASHLLNGRLFFFTSVKEARKFSAKIKEELAESYSRWESRQYNDGLDDIDEDE